MVHDVTVTAAPAIDAASHPLCHMSGQLIFKEIGYALHADDGKDFWLDMDSNPQHLIERTVSIAGRHYGRDLIWVEAIGPAEPRKG